MPPPNLPKTKSALGRRSEDYNPNDFFEGFDESSLAPAAFQEAWLTRTPLARRISNWLRSLSSGRFKSFSRATKRNPWRLVSISTFERLEPRLCLSYEPVASAAVLPTQFYAGDSLTLDCPGSSSSMDMNAPNPGQLHYHWTISGIDVNQDSGMITVPWSDLETTYGWAKGTTATSKSVSLYVSDNNGNSTNVVRGTSIAANRPPIADAGGVISNASGVIRREYHFAYVSGSVILDGSASSDPDMIDSRFYRGVSVMTARLNPRIAG